MSDVRVPLTDVDYGPEEDQAVLRVLRGRWLSSGREVAAFEQAFAAFLGVDHAVAVANGTAALHLAFMALGLGPGDEIVQPAINFVAAANMSVALGAVPVFADIVAQDDPRIDAADIESRITPRTKAVLVMHYGGYPCHMAEIVSLCRQYGLALIEDACHAVGARYFDPAGRPPHGKMVGNLGDVGCFSFFANKNLVTGEGGLLATNRSRVADRVRLLRSHGMTSLSWDRHLARESAYDVLCNGYNYRLDELHAALGRCQLAKLTHNNRRRGALVSAYRERLNSLAGWTIPFQNDPSESGYHLMVAVAPSEDARRRAADALRQAGIQTSRHYPCVPELKAFSPQPLAHLARSKDFAARAISLPLFPSLPVVQVDEICSVIRGASSASGTTS